MESYCVKQKKFTECMEPRGYKKSKNGKLMFYCKCTECGIIKYKFVKTSEGMRLESSAGGSSRRLIAPELSSGGSLDEAILETMGKLGKVGLSQAIKSKMVKRASAKMVDKMLDNIANKIN